MKTSHFVTSALVILAGCFPSGLRAQSSSDINVNGARPLNEALFVIDERFNLPVIYEEISYEAKNHLVQGRDIGLVPDRNYPKGGTLDVHLVNHEENGYNALQTAMAAYKNSYPTLGYSTMLNQGIVFFPPKWRMH